MSRSLLLSCVLVFGGACRGQEQQRPPADIDHQTLAQAGAEVCASCHAAIADDWRESGHARAWRDPLVAREYASDPDRSCVDCHAPRTPADRLPHEREADAGVDCVSCHFEADRLVPTQTLARSESCARCHQFRFLPVDDSDALAYAGEAWLQDTFGEWSRSDAAAAGIGCSDCHMPERGEDRHRSHGFPGMHDPALVAAAVSVEITAHREGGHVFVDVRLEPGAIGHAFPTGDLFRRGVLRVWTREREPDDDTWLLTRTFAATSRRGDEPGRMIEIEDSRIPPPGAGPPPSKRFRLRSAAAREVGWRLELQAPTHDPPRADDPVVIVAAGRVAIE